MVVLNSISPMVKLRTFWTQKENQPTVKQTPQPMLVAFEEQPRIYESVQNRADFGMFSFFGKAIQGQTVGGCWLL